MAPYSYDCDNVSYSFPANASCSLRAIIISILLIIYHSSPLYLSSLNVLTSSSSRHIAATGIYADMIATENRRTSHESMMGEGGNGDGWDGVLRRVVIGVPANCSEKKKAATRKAARTAGFTEVRM